MNECSPVFISPQSALPTLHLVCGKIASGKSTLTQQLASAPKTLLINEDDWLANLYPGELTTIADYVRCTDKLRKALAPHIVALLKAGLSVVLDFPANTPTMRRWLRELIDQSGITHQLHYLNVSDEVCKARLRRRNAEGLHPFTTSEAEFDQITRYFVPPALEEGFNVLICNALE